MDFNNIKQQGYWKDTANSLNDNFNRIGAELAKIAGLTERSKGMFITLVDLQLAYPKPTDGDWALVGIALPASVYVGKNGKWTASGGTGGTGSVDMGGVLKSTKITDLTEILGSEVYPIVIELTATPSPVEFTGTEQNVTIGWKITKNSSPATLSKLSLTQDGVNLDIPTVASGSKTAVVNKDGTIVFRMEAVVNGRGSSEFCYLQMIRPMYFGFSNATTAVQFSGLTKQAPATSPNGTFQLTNGNAANYLWLCVPSSMTIGGVRIGNSSIPLQPAELVQSNSYRCYRSTSAIASTGSLSVVIS